GLFFTEPLAQVHHGDDFSAQVDHALEIVGSVGHGGDFRHPHDFMQGSDGYALGLASHLAAHDVQVTAHGSGSSEKPSARTRRSTLGAPVEIAAVASFVFQAEAVERFEQPARHL